MWNVEWRMRICTPTGNTMNKNSTKQTKTKINIKTLNINKLCNKRLYIVFYSITQNSIYHAKNTQKTRKKFG